MERQTHLKHIDSLQSKVLGPGVELHQVQQEHQGGRAPYSPSRKQVEGKETWGRMEEAAGFRGDLRI